MQPIHVTICSPFRDSASLIDSYMDRLLRMQLASIPVECRRVFVEGDSVDNTWQHLKIWANDDKRVTLIKCDTHTPHFGSVVNPQRFRTLATVFNAALDAVDLEWTDYVLFLPCDVHYKPDLLQRLLAADKDLVAPFVWTETPPRFFDTWGFVRLGEEFERFTQADVAGLYGTELLAMDSVGGVVLIKAAVLRAGCRYTVTEVDRGLCQMARAKGFGVYADPTTHVRHPPL